MAWGTALKNPKQQPFPTRNRTAAWGPWLSDDSLPSSRSLFSEILHWMLAPLLLLWPISIVVTYDVASRAANKPHDQELVDNVSALARQVYFDANQHPVFPPSPAVAMLVRSNNEDTVYYQVLGGGGVVLAGDGGMPSPDDKEYPDNGKVRLRDSEYHGESIRVAATQVCQDDTSSATCALIQIGETRAKRAALSAQIVSGVLLPQFAIVPLALIFVWFGLLRGVAPLNRLRDAIGRRRPGDLSPVEVQSVPDELRPLILAFNDMMARLDHTLDAQQRFIADAAHQMRTPLAGLRMQVELALDETDPEQLRLMLHKVLSGAERSAHLINQLLALARVEASTEKLDEFAIIDLASLTREIVADLVPAARHKKIDLGMEALPARALLVSGNTVLLREMVSNLVDNAIKYTPVGGNVTVMVEADDAVPDRVLLRVQDNGQGIPVDARERVFERFYRVLGTNAEGSGLGLSIAREVAELHGGGIRIEDNPGGVGVQMVVWLSLLPE